mgnify:CR=1 FL=1
MIISCQLGMYVWYPEPMPGFLMRRISDYNIQLNSTQLNSTLHEWPPTASRIKKKIANDNIFISIRDGE